jgi:hypothetical protein
MNIPGFSGVAKDDAKDRYRTEGAAAILSGSLVMV